MVDPKGSGRVNVIGLQGIPAGFLWVGNSSRDDRLATRTLDNVREKESEEQVFPALLVALSMHGR